MRPAVVAWAGLAAYITAVDALLIHGEHQGREGYCTMSTAFEEALRHPMKRWPVAVAWGLVTLHLFDAWIPVSIWQDHLIKWVERSRNGRS